MSAQGPVFSRRGGMVAVVSAATAVLASTGTGATAQPATDRTRGRDALQADVDAIRATGATGVLAEVQGPRGRLVARAGAADLTGERPVPWNAYYRIGSDTKTFTATVVLQLAGEGRLGLNDTVDRWLPGLVHGHGNDGRRITLTNLLRQTSGLNDYVAVAGGGDDFTPEGYLKGRFRVTSPRQQVAAAVSRPPLWLPDAADPAREQRWGYSNTNYVLLGLVIEKVTGHPWAQEIHERVIAPLGLRHTLVPGTSAYVPQPTATAYTQFPGGTRLTDTSLATGGGADGGIISTPHDLAVFLRALLGGRLLHRAQLAAMKRTVAAPDWIQAEGVRYGLGIAWRPGSGGPRGGGSGGDGPGGDGSVGRGDTGVWFHGGTHLGVVSESGVTADGSRAATAAIFTLRTDERGDTQAKAALRLVDRALRR
ncbi:serine hydrolase domain-containing protein [Streptomyces flavofungini]|uniref:Beta-lactamase family protein n=1 Tax=Streptomyces flavofungini TaxID=68200 RepID=A0ABS0X9E4_9ACTN|nr:serine hydrolase domain-containing protein [Streptomyces flavofungini]MBJ3809808.1 beta-lactamase family protein [Streptomyces flavofungini]GHC80861.1 serine hydrolase [Streptomyces flavofungini]